MVGGCPLLKSTENVLLLDQGFVWVIRV